MKTISVTSYYNENDAYAAQWIRNLADAGHLPSGTVDERSILDVGPADLVGYNQYHFFAGLGGWPLALDLAGWPRDRPVWTGSCPCQPFSSAGKRQGADDTRHLWPAWFRLIRECRPATIFGEQVTSADVIGRQGERTAAALCDQGPQAEQGLSFGAPREDEGEEEENRLRPGFLHSGDTAADQYRDLRSDWPVVEPRRWAHLGQSLARPDRAEGAVPLFEFAGGLPRDQQRYGRLGRAALGPASLGDLGEEKGEVERLIAAIGEKFDDEVEWAWLDRVRADLEGIGYTFGAAVLGAHSVGAPHIRQRLFWVADAGRMGWRARPGDACRSESRAAALTDNRGATGGVADADQQRKREAGSTGTGEWIGGNGSLGGVGDADEERHDGCGSCSTGWNELTHGCGLGNAAGEQVGRAGQPWQDSVWLACFDGKARRTQPTIFPLAHAGEWGTGSRMGILRGAGNAISPPVAAVFIEAVMDLARRASIARQCLSGDGLHATANECEGVCGL